VFFGGRVVFGWGRGGKGRLSMPTVSRRTRVSVTKSIRTSFPRADMRARRMYMTSRRGMRLEAMMVAV